MSCRYMEFQQRNCVDLKVIYVGAEEGVSNIAMSILDRAWLTSEVKWRRIVRIMFSNAAFFMIDSQGGLLKWANDINFEDMRTGY